MTETENNIIRYASGVFIRSGCHSVTMDGIASGMHISKRTLYECFGSKEALLTACLRYIHSEEDAYFRHIAEETGDLLFLVLFFTQVMSRISQRMSLLLREMAQYYPVLLKDEVLSPKSSHFERLREIIVKAQQDGQLREGLNIDTVMDSILMIMNHLHISTPEDITASLTFDNRRIVLISELLYNFFRGMLSAETIRSFDNNQERYKEMLSTKNINFF